MPRGGLKEALCEDSKELSMHRIAELSGVSIATVSRVINQNGRYSKETEQRVQNIIEKYHYTPNLTAKRLRTGSTNYVAVIVPDITNEFFASIAQYLQEGLLKNGFLALICNTAESMDIQQQYLDNLGIVNLAGIIFVSGSTDIKQTGLHKLPAIYIDRTPEDAALKNALVVESDNYGGACMAVNELYQKGCRRIAIMRSSQSISTHSIRQSGYMDQLARFQLCPQPEWDIRVDEVSFKAAQRRMDELIGKGLSFDGLFCVTDWLAAGALASLEKHGIAVPDSVKIVGFDDISIASLTAKPITTIHQQIDVIGKTAVDEIIRLIHGGVVRATRIQIGVSLKQRKTT